MGRDGATDRPASAVELDTLRALTHEAIAAGAFGFTTSRTFAHRAVDGTLVPGTHAALEELLAKAGF